MLSIGMYSQEMETLLLFQEHIKACKFAIKLEDIGIYSDLSERINEGCLPQYLFLELSTYSEIREIFSLAEASNHIQNFVIITDLDCGLVSTRNVNIELTSRENFFQKSEEICHKLISDHVDFAAYTDVHQDHFMHEHDVQLSEKVRSLPSRQREILSLLRYGLKSSEIATELKISINTVNTHLQTIYKTLGIANRKEASRIASAMRLLPKKPRLRLCAKTN